MLQRLARVLLMATALVAASGTVLAETIGTYTAGQPYNSRVGNIGGSEYVNTFGQTFVVPNNTDVVLQDWTLWLYRNVAQDVVFRFGIATWDGTMAGKVLYESDPTSMTGPVGQLQQFTFTPGVTLAPGQDYVAYITASRDQAGSLGSASLPLPGPSYSQGKLVFIGNGYNYGAMFTDSWTSVGSGWDLYDTAFTATFVPPPAITVAVDVMPGKAPNLVNTKANGMLPVAVLSTADFDVTTIDPSTLVLGDPALTGVASPVRWAWADVNGDGLADLVLHFSMRELAANAAIGPTSSELDLAGTTADGTDVVGGDAIVVVH